MTPSADELLFSTTTDVGTDEVVVSVSGEVDLVTAPDLRATLDEALGHGRARLVLDASRLAFMDATGLRELVRAYVRLAGVGGTLEIRNPPALLVRLVEVTGLADVLHIEHAEPASDELVEGIATRATPTVTDLLDSVLHLVVALTRTAVAGADGVSVSLRRAGQLVTAAASDQRVRDIDRVQYDLGDGPGVAASADGLQYYVEAAAAEPRWPNFMARVLEAGFDSVLSSPLVGEPRPLGALNMYSRDAFAFGGRDREIATALAEHTTALVVEVDARPAVDRLAGTLRAALRAREVIAQAQGILMDRGDLSAAEAHAVLRRSSRATNQPVPDVAEEIVSSLGRSDRSPPLRSRLKGAPGDP